MKYVIGVIGVIILMIFAIIMIVSRGPKSTTGTTGDPVIKLVQEAKDGSVSYTMQGRVVGQEERRSVRILVDKNQVRAEVLKGYNETIEKSQSYSNTDQAYETFLSALDVAGFANKREYTPADERGVCPLGRTYIYEMKRGAEEKARLWSTSCGTKQGTFGGKAGIVRQLFENQVPEYTKFTTGVKF